MNYFTMFIGGLIGFVFGRYYPEIQKFLHSIVEKEVKNKYGDNN